VRCPGPPPLAGKYVPEVLFRGQSLARVRSRPLFRQTKPDRAMSDRPRVYPVTSQPIQSLQPACGDQTVAATITTGAWHSMEFSIYLLGNISHPSVEHSESLSGPLHAVRGQDGSLRPEKLERIAHALDEDR